MILMPQWFHLWFKKDKHDKDIGAAVGDDIWPQVHLHLTFGWGADKLMQEHYLNGNYWFLDLEFRGKINQPVAACR